jgi:hypothetical protein
VPALFEDAAEAAERILKRWARIAWATVKCEWHCLCHLLEGHCGYRKYENGRLIKIAAVTGSVFKDSLKFEKVFWQEK